MVVVDRRGRRRLLIYRTHRVRPMALPVLVIAISLISNTCHTTNRAFANTFVSEACALCLPFASIPSKTRQQHKRIIGRAELRHRRSTILRKLNLSRTPLGKKCTSVLAFADGVSQPYSRMSAETTCDRVFEISGHSHLAMTAGCEQGNVCPMSSQKFIKAWWLFTQPCGAAVSSPTDCKPATHLQYTQNNMSTCWFATNRVLTPLAVKPQMPTATGNAA